MKTCDWGLIFHSFAPECINRTHGLMNGFEFEGFSDGDWDAHEELAWSEFDWQRYLHRNEAEIREFLGLYHRLRHLPEHLDEIARRMGWDAADWSPSDEDDDDDDDDEDSIVTPPAVNEGSASQASTPDPMEPYTVHKHPVYIVTRGLYQHLNHIWELYFNKQHNLIKPIFISRLINSLHAGEVNALMAINSIDMGDFNLAVCHFKNALGALNHSMSMIQQLPAGTPRVLRTFQTEFLTGLFDLREVWLRVMTDCRDEERRHTRGGDSDSES